MAIRNDPRLYTGGAVEFDSTPSVNMYANLLAKKQAKDEALNQFFEKELMDLSPTGVREVHKPGIISELDNLRRKWAENKDKILKNPMDRMNFNREMQNVAYNIGKAKEMDKFFLELGKARAEGKYDPDDDDIGIIDKAARSVYDPKAYKQDGVSLYGWGDVSASVPAFDADRQNKFWSAITKGLSAGKEYDYSKAKTNPSTRQVVVPFQKVFTKDQIRQIADEASNLTEGDKSARKYYNKILDDPSSAGYQELQNAYSKFYTGIVDTPEKAAAADAIIRASVPQEVGEEQELQRNAPTVKNYVSSGGTQSGTNVNDIYTVIYDAAKGKKTEGKPYLQVNLLPLDAQSLVVDFARKATGDNAIGQGNLKVILGNDDKLGVYDADNNDRLIGYLSKVGTNLKVQPDVKSKKAVISQGNTPTQKTKKDPLGLGL